MSVCVHTQHMRDPAQPTAVRLVAELFPHARAAWLGGSVARGVDTPTSDLDIVVLTADDPVHRRSLLYSGWPVELFVHTDASMHKYFASDIARRQPSLPRMVGEALLLRDQDGAGHRWGQTARQVLSDGPAPLTQAELDDARYTITDLIDDLAGNPPPTETAAIAALLWQHVLTLSLTGSGQWSGTGKGLVRALPADRAERGLAALRSAIGGSPSLLVQLADEILADHGGRHWDGYRSDDSKDSTPHG